MAALWTEQFQLFQSYRGRKVRLISTSDNGLYDGINKAISYISGKFVLFMNSDDVASCLYIRQAATVLVNSSCDYIYGNIEYGNIIRKPRFCSPSSAVGVFQRMPFPHVSLMMKVQIFKKVGLFDTQYRIASDLDFVNRLLAMSRNGKYLDLVAARCSLGGLSSGNKQVFESLRVAIKHGRNPLCALIVALGVYAFRRIVLPIRG